MSLSEKFWKLFGRVADALSLLGVQGVSAMVGSFTLSAWAASATTWLNAYGPIAWVFSGFVGVLLFVVGLLIWARYRLYSASASVIAKQVGEEDVVNPLDDAFDRKRVRLAQMASPIDMMVDSKTFTRCEILGPANVVIIDGVVMHENEMHRCDFACVRLGSRIANAIKLRRCTIQRSKLHGITFLMPPGSERLPGLEGANWITEHPPAQQVEARAAT